VSSSVVELPLFLCLSSTLQVLDVEDAYETDDDGVESGGTPSRKSYGAVSAVCGVFASGVSRSVRRRASSLRRSVELSAPGTAVSPVLVEVLIIA
jgi:hypothetical protein